jgi:hypothetical protein
MTPETFVNTVINPGLHTLRLLGGPRPTDDIRRFLLTIALQESGPDLKARYQNSPSTDPGPARGWWQFEEGGGVAGVLNHTTTEVLVENLCAHCSVVSDSGACWRAIEGNDAMATGFARLLIYTDPYPVPTDAHDAWNCYMRLWRPGKPHPETWEGNWNTAMATV